LRTTFAHYSEETLGELAIFEAAAGIRLRLGPDAIRNYIVSKTDNVSDLLEAAVLLRKRDWSCPGRSPFPSCRSCRSSRRSPIFATRRTRCATGSRSPRRARS
jgi:hypothetical protein